MKGSIFVIIFAYNSNASSLFMLLVDANANPTQMTAFLNALFMQCGDFDFLTLSCKTYFAFETNIFSSLSILSPS